jgi:hypothetical protein
MLGVPWRYFVYNIAACATSCCRHLLANISRWDEVPPPRPPEQSLSSDGVQAVWSVEANTPIAGGAHCYRCPETRQSEDNPYG